MSPPESPPPAARPRARAPAEVALVFAAWRGLLALLVLLGGAMTHERPDRDPNTFAWQAFPGSYFWDSWARWDSGWYMLVLQKGYAPGPDARQRAAFFPLYPYASRAVAGVVGNPWAAGLLVSNTALLGALFFLRRIALTGLEPDGARRALAYVLGFPASFFLSAFYPEGLFLLTATAAFDAYLRGRYVACGAWGALACLTRHLGLAVFVACGLGYLAGLRRGAARPGAGALGLLLMPCGTLAFMALLYIRQGDPLAFVSAHGAWGRSASWPHRTLGRALAQIDWALPRDMMNTIDLMDALGALAFLALPLLLVRRFDPALPIFGVLLVLVPLASGSVRSLMRVEATSFPAFLALARLGRHRDVDRALTFGMALFLGLLAIQFANWYWVG